MKRCIIILLFSLFVIQTRAQNPAIDSLNRLISTAKTDTERINLATQKIALLGEVNIDSSMVLGRKIIEEAKQ